MKNTRMPLYALLVALWTPFAYAAVCASEDFVTRVSGGGECLVIEAFGVPPPVPPAAMVVWLHGDQSDGAPVVSHVQPARQAAARFAADHVVSIALWRPGYANAQGETSGGEKLGSSDSYTKTNMQIVGDAIARLKAHYQPARTILVGHSGGAATTANLLGMQPGLADAAVLVSCPCDLRAWRAGRRWWPNSEDPLKWADQVRPPVKVVALTGTADTNTSPKLAQTYLNVLVAHQVDARFTSIPDVPHNGALRAPEVMDALASVLK